MTNFNIRIVSDPVCPFCYIGKKRLDRAIDVYKKVYPGGRDDTFTISWHPYYLDPTSPKVGIPLVERMVQRFGAQRLEAMQARLQMMGRSEGINFTFGGKIGNTRDAHRLVQLAKTKVAAGDAAAEDRVVAALMRMYFEESGDITSRELLVEAGVRGGLEEPEIRTWLEEGKGGPEVDALVQQAYAEGIQGVPHFTIQQDWTIDGAEDVQVFIEQFAAAKEGTEGVEGTKEMVC